MYIFDTSIFIILFTYYYPSRFPTLWGRFNELAGTGHIISTRENLREISDQLNGFREWADGNGAIFQEPDEAEAAFITGIYTVPHFLHNIEQQKIHKGGLNADPFVIAKAAVLEGAVVTAELIKPHAAKIPNICEHFGVRCMNLEQFMEEEDWSF